MEITLTIFFALLGVAIGSFLNVCIDRLPAGKSLVSPPSHCDACQHRLGLQDLVPVFSYLWLRGRCRYCRAPIPLRSPLVEIGSGLLFALAFTQYGLTLRFAISAFYGCIFLVILFIDWEHKLILNKVTYPAAAAALIISTLQLQPGIVNIPVPWPLVAGGVNGVVNSIIGGSIGFLFFLSVYLIGALVYHAEVMGMGDVKMAGLIGLVTGFPMVFVALFIGIFIGGVAAIVLLLFREKGRKDVIPYGTFLATGPIITLLWGSSLLNWYFGLF